MTGICRIGDLLFVAHQTAAARVAVLDAETLSVRADVCLPGARDVHSLAAWEGGVAVASTGTDEILWYRYDGADFVDRTVLWTASPERKDTLHVNGLTAHRDALLCCAFGPRRTEEDLWSESRGGFVYDVAKGRFVLRGLAHPHSPAVRGDDELVLCESARRSFRSADQPIVELDGYTRGVACLDDGRTVIGTSVTRVKSRSSDQLLNPADEGVTAGRCALHVVDPDGTVHQTLSLEGYGKEIYDVFPLGGP